MDLRTVPVRSEHPQGAMGAPRDSAKRPVMSSVTKTRTDELAEIFIARVGDRRQCAHTSVNMRVAQKRLAKVVGGMSERDNIGAQPASDLIDGAPPKAAAKIATMIGLFFEQPQRRIVGVISPVHATRLKIFAQRLDRPQKLALLHGKSANRELGWARRLTSSNRASSSVSESLPPTTPRRHDRHRESF